MTLMQILKRFHGPLLQFGMAICGALLLGFLTFHVMGLPPFNLGIFLFIVGPAYVLLKCIGVDSKTLEADSFFRTYKFCIIVNAALGATIFLILGNIFRSIIRASRKKGDH